MGPITVAISTLTGLGMEFYKTYQKKKDGDVLRDMAARIVLLQGQIDSLLKWARAIAVLLSLILFFLLICFLLIKH